FFQEAFEVVSRCGPRRLLAGDAAAGERLVNLVVEIVPVGHYQEREIPPHFAAYLLGEESHRIGFAAALRVPEHAEPAEIGMRALDDIHRAFGYVRGLRLREFSLADGARCSIWFRRGASFQRQLDDAMRKSLPGRE